MNVVQMRSSQVKNLASKFIVERENGVTYVWPADRYEPEEPIAPRKFCCANSRRGWMCEHQPNN